MRKVAIVTGASGGIGRFIALGLADSSHHVVLVCRNADRGRATQDWIAKLVPHASTELRLVDLSVVAATRGLGIAMASAHPRLSLLVNNAGIFTRSRQLTVEGIESVLAVNHLAPSVLIESLEKSLLAGAPSRIVSVGSSTSDHARINPDDLELRQGWGMMRAYARSKLALLMAGLAKASQMRGSGVVVNVVHPGAVASGLIRERGAIGLAWRIMSAFLLTEEQGADTPLHVALSPEWASRTGFYVKCRTPARVNVLALNSSLVERVLASTKALTERH